ncbi:zinc ribbon domain-containing protein [Saccharopolyspora sp. CA-218241]|uniref:zinc ribbon domain-containing protein n=1 Tax=Saccharopolyspora sp. CA-218241 TaxID=3240027 RepID=UPI003D973CFF
MKADPAVQRRLLDLAEVDADLNRVTHRRRTLPELTEVGEAERDLTAKRDDLVVVQTSYNDLDREVKRLEGEVDQLRKREQRDRDLMSGGASPKQLEDLERELEALTRRQGVLEDELLDVMEQREALEMNVNKAAEAATAAEERVAEVQERRDAAVADLDTAEARGTASRRLILDNVPEGLAALYERIREQKGIGAGLLQGARCGACRLELDRSALNDLREAAPDDVVRCEECGAILVRESGK